MAKTSTKEEIDIDILLDSINGSTYALILHNDEVNTFEWVIQSLIDICKHTWHQAEQCAMIIHNKGKYAVKQGEEEKMREMRSAFAERGIGTTVEAID